jgi:hypothetical protein
VSKKSDVREDTGLRDTCPAFRNIRVGDIGDGNMLGGMLLTPLFPVSVEALVREATASM